MSTKPPKKQALLQAIAEHNATNPSDIIPISRRVETELLTKRGKPRVKTIKLKVRELTSSLAPKYLEVLARAYELSPTIPKGTATASGNILKARYGVARDPDYIPEKETIPVLSNERKKPPQRHQIDFATSFANSLIRGAIAIHALGSGKTLTAVLTSQEYLDTYPENKVIVITPASLLANFIDELFEFHGGKPFNEAIETKKEWKAKNKEAIRKLQDSRYEFMSYEKYMRKPVDCKNALMIIDEAHNLRSSVGDVNHGISKAEAMAKIEEQRLEGTRQTKYIKDGEGRFHDKDLIGSIRAFQVMEHCAKHAHKVLLMTATPLVNTPFDVVNLMNFIEGYYVIDDENVFTNMINSKASLIDFFGCKVSIFRDVDPKMFPRKDEYIVNIEMSPEFEEIYKKIPRYVKDQIKPSSEVVIDGVKHDTTSIIFDALQSLVKTKEEKQAHMNHMNSLATFGMIGWDEFDDELSKVKAGTATSINNLGAYYNGVRRAVNSLLHDKTPKIKWAVNRVVFKYDNGRKRFLVNAKGKKMSNLDKDGQPNEKTIIFSHFVGAGSELIAKKLRNKYKIKVGIIAGGISQQGKANIVDAFNHNEIRVVIITKAGAEGLNFKEARNVIVLEPSWNENTINQVIGRGIRFKSHLKLPENEQFVNVYRILNTMKNDQKFMKDIQEGKADYVQYLKVQKDLRDLKAQQRALMERAKRVDDMFTEQELERAKKGDKKFIAKVFNKNNMVRFGLDKKDSMEQGIEKIMVGLDAESEQKQREIEKKELENTHSIDLDLYVMSKGKDKVIQDFMASLNHVPTMEECVSNEDEALVNEIEIQEKILGRRLTDEEKTAIKRKIEKQVIEKIITKKEIKFVNIGSFADALEKSKKQTEAFIKSRPYLNKEGMTTQKALQQYFTPHNIVEIMIKRSGMKKDNRFDLHVLEPTAGGGALVQGVLDIKPTKEWNIDMIEYDEDNRKFLKDKIVSVNQLVKLKECRDFLSCILSDKYDYIIMNPPFNLRNWTDADGNKRNYYDYDFFLRAFSMLKVGGTLTGIGLLRKFKGESKQKDAFENWMKIYKKHGGDELFELKKINWGSNGALGNVPEKFELEDKEVKNIDLVIYNVIKKDLKDVNKDDVDILAFTQSFIKPTIPEPSPILDKERVITIKTEEPLSKSTVKLTTNKAKSQLIAKDVMKTRKLDKIIREEAKESNISIRALEKNVQSIIEDNLAEEFDTDPPPVTIPSNSKLFEMSSLVMDGITNNIIKLEKDNKRKISKAKRETNNKKIESLEKEFNSALPRHKALEIMSLNEKEIKNTIENVIQPSKKATFEEGDFGKPPTFKKSKPIIIPQKKETKNELESTIDKIDRKLNDLRSMRRRKKLDDDEIKRLEERMNNIRLEKLRNEVKIRKFLIQDRKKLEKEKSDLESELKKSRKKETKVQIETLIKKINNQKNELEKRIDSINNKLVEMDIEDEDDF